MASVAWPATRISCSIRRVHNEAEISGGAELVSGRVEQSEKCLKVSRVVSSVHEDRHTYIHCIRGKMAERSKALESGGFIT